MTDTSAASNRRIVLTEDQLPTHWYNLNADLPEPTPPHLHPGTKGPLGPDDLAPLFPSGLIEQEVTTDRFVPIPEPVRSVYATWRPSPLIRATRLEEALGTPARIYYKYEGLSPVGSHKPNTAVAQAYYNSIDGVGKITTETGAGQWGSALAYACALFGLQCEVWQVAASFETKPYRRLLMETFGATVHSSPSELTEAGRGMRAKFGADTPGSLGMAVSEAVEAAATDPDARYALGSVLNHVMLHQTVIGEETLRQLDIAGERPDVVIGCAGGGSNLAGLAFPFVRENLAGHFHADIVAVEPTAAPSMTKGEYRYDFGDVAGLTPLLKMYTLGQDFVPDPIHAGGLRYHGMAPMVSNVVHSGLMRAVAIDQDTAFAAGVQFARTEGIVPAPESNHAVAVAIQTAQECADTGTAKVIVLGLSGNGQLDLPAYGDYVSRS